MFRISLVCIALGASVALAQPISIFKETGKSQRNWANMRIGASSGSVRPEICLEISPIALLSAEACGTGSGFLHKDPAPEIAHFRTKTTLMSWETPIGSLQPRFLAGFAELQVGEDTSGFYFTSTGPTGVETSGPELGLSMRCLTSLAVGIELVTELQFNTALFVHAPKLVRPMSELQPTLSVSVGVGF